MNVFGELVLWLLGTGFIGGVILTLLAFLITWLIIKLGSEKNEN